MIALTIVATLQSVGIILSISLLIAPGAIALLLVRRFIHALLLAVAVAIGCSAGGGVAGVLSRQRASADYRGAVYRAVCGRLCRKHDPR